MYHKSEVSRHEPTAVGTPKSDNSSTSDSIDISENNAGSNDDRSITGSGIGEAIAEIILQPHTVPTTGGGGTSNDLDWGDDDKNKNCRPRKRR